MNVFDFDGTLYAGDSTLDFWRYALLKHPSCARSLPAQLMGALLYVMGRIEKDDFKGRFYGFLRHIPNTDDLVTDFWNGKQTRLSEDMLRKANNGDLVVSASPRFLIQPICERLGLASIASEVSPDTGALLGPNCSGHEKCRRIEAEGFELPFENGYTDSRSDTPMMALATRAWLVSLRKNHVDIVPFYGDSPE